MRNAVLHSLRCYASISDYKCYRPGWVWYKLQEEFSWFSEDELYEIAETLGYRRGWARHKWIEQEEKRAQSQCQPHASQLSMLDRFLDLLGLRMPFTRDQLKRAYRQKAKLLHPDTGGSHDDFLMLGTAFESLQSYAVGGES